MQLIDRIVVLKVFDHTIQENIPRLEQAIEEEDWARATGLASLIDGLRLGRLIVTQRREGKKMPHSYVDVLWEAMKWELETLRKRGETEAYERVVNLMGQIGAILDKQFRDSETERR